MSRGEPGVIAQAPWRGAAAAAAMAAALAAGAAASVPSRHGGQLAGDEPQYVLSATSLASDGDLNIADELAAGKWRAYGGSDLPRQTRPLAGGREISPHSPGLPLLLALPVALAGWQGAIATMVLISAAAAGATVWLAVRRLGTRPRSTTLVVALGFTSAPLAVYGAQVYPELLGGLITVLLVGALLAPLDRAGLSILAAGVVALPWLSVKFGVIGAVVAALGLRRLAAAGRRREALALLAVLLAAAAMFVVTHRWLYGGWTPYATGDHFVGGELTVMGEDLRVAGRARRLAGLMVDRRFGIAAWQPLWLLLVPALARWWHRARAPQRGAAAQPGAAAAVVGPLAAGWLTATFLAVTMHGWWFAGRHVVVILPAALAVLAWWVDGEPQPSRPGATGTAHALRRAPGSRQRAVVIAGALGLWSYGWLIAAGLAGRLAWAVDPPTTFDPLRRALRPLLPDGMTGGLAADLLTAAWAAAGAGAWWWYARGRGGD